jgi:hypothetical protein
VSSSAELPFVAAPPGSVESVTRSAERAAQAWGLSSPRLIRVGMNGIFATDDGVLLRVTTPSAPPEQAIWLAGVVARAGVRVPRYARKEPLIFNDHAVFAVEMVEVAGTVDWTEVGAMVARLHLLDVDEIAAGFPLPFCGNFPWWRFDELFADVGAELDADSRGAMQRAVARDLPLLWNRDHRIVVCHGDVHPGNVLPSAAGPVLLDWDLVCRGPAAWDHAALMTWAQQWGGERHIYDDFARGYGHSFRGDPLGEAIAELRLVAATLMRVRAGRTNPDAAAEAEQRLRYWRGDPHAPQWNPQ